GSGWPHVGSLGVAARDLRRGSAPTGRREVGVDSAPPTVHWPQVGGCRMGEAEYLMHMAVADRLREARAASAARKSVTEEETSMDEAGGCVVPAGGGKHLEMAAPGRFAALKLLGHETNDSIMLFEEPVPAGTKSFFHLHRDSDEVAWVLAGEITFKIGDE